jgi:hypothetical protein
MLVPLTLWMKWAQCATKKTSGFMWMQLMQVRALLMVCKSIGEMTNANKIVVEKPEGRWGIILKCILRIGTYDGLL